MAIQKKKIGIILSIVLVVVAIIADLFSLIPGISNIIASLFWLIFLGITYLKGRGIINFRRLVTPLVSWIIEQVPGGSVLPTITLGLIISLLLIKAEDKTGISVTKIAGGVTGGIKGGAVSPQNTPLYKDGVRNPIKNAPIYQNGEGSPTGYPINRE